MQCCTGKPFYLLCMDVTVNFIMSAAQRTAYQQHRLWSIQHTIEQAPIFFHHFNWQWYTACNLPSLPLASTGSSLWTKLVAAANQGKKKLIRLKNASSANLHTTEKGKVERSQSCQKWGTLCSVGRGPGMAKYSNHSTANVNIGWHVKARGPVINNLD